MIPKYRPPEKNKKVKMCKECGENPRLPSRAICFECKRVSDALKLVRRNRILKRKEQKQKELDMRFRVKHPSKKKETKKLDIIWSKKVKDVADNKCEYCGCVERLNSHHFYSRSDHKIRHDINNGFCLCVSHHVFSDKFSAHKTPADFVEWAINKRGKKWYKDLQNKHWNNKL